MWPLCECVHAMCVYEFVTVSAFQPASVRVRKSLCVCESVCVSVSVCVYVCVCVCVCVQGD